MPGQFQCLLADLRRWHPSAARDRFYTVSEPSIWATVAYRVSRACWLIRLPGVRLPMRFVAFAIYKFSELALGIAIHPRAEIGPGLYVGHAGAVAVDPGVHAGANLSIGPEVVIGPRHFDHEGVPRLGDDVFIGAGAKLLGPIRVGSGARIGANAVVLSDVPDNATAVGVPAVIRKRAEKQEEQ